MESPMKDKLTFSADELDTLDLPDKRLQKRGQFMLDRLCQTPNMSLPNTFKSNAELKAAYRFFDQDCVTSEKVIEPHIKKTVQRINDYPLVILLNDTTDIDMSHMQSVKDLGVLNDTKRPGCSLHLLAAFTPERLPLGAVSAQFIIRDPDELGKKIHNNKRSIEEKESYRWIEDYRKACEIGKNTETHIVYIADREADIYELFLEAQLQNKAADLIVRGNSKRKVKINNESPMPIQEAIEKAHILGEIEFFIPAIKGLRNRDRKRRQRESRQVKQTIKCIKLAFPPSRHKKKLQSVKEVYAIYLQEIDVPENAEPINWLLLTTLKVENLEDAKKVIDLYLARWGIETFFHILKTGCEIEELQLEHAARLLPCLAMYLIVAWRVMYVMMMGRNAPKISCEVIFEEDEWQCTYVIVNKKEPPEKPPTLGEMILMVASMGGHLGRKSDGAPGPKVIWRGLQKLYFNTEGWNAYKQISLSRKSCG